MNAFVKHTLVLGVLSFSTLAAAQITFYESESFRGRSFSTQGQVENFSGYGYNDRASSAVVEREFWEVCEDVRFGGRCAVLRPGRYPSLSSMGLDNRISSVRTTNPNARFDLEFFSSSVCHTSGFGEGKIYLGELTNVASGNTSFVFTVAPGVVPGRFITATATRRVVVGTHTVEESTSEFSRCLPVPGLTGQWAANLKLSCAYTERLEPYVILRGRFCVTNEGTMSSPPALVRFYLASGPERSAADLYLGRVAVRPLAAQQTRCVRFHGRLPVRAAFADKYVLAVVDANPRSPDNHETDPVFACAVCPDPGPSSR